MELIFQFFKERNFSELIQDFINLFRKVYKHYFLNIFTLSLPVIGFIMIVTFFLTSQFDNSNFDTFFGATLFFLAGLILVILIYILATLSTEYMVLLRNKNSTDFTYMDVLKSYRQNIRKYLVGSLALFIFGLIIFIPFAIVYVILAFIPLIGGLISQFISMMLTIYISSVFLLYRDGKSDIKSSFKLGYDLVKKNLFNHSLAFYLFQFITSIVTLIIFAIPVVTFIIIQYNTLGFDDDFFVSYWGKVCIALLAGLGTIAYLLMQMLNTSFSFLIYCSNYESYYKEHTLDNIQQIGQNIND